MARLSSESQLSARRGMVDSAPVTALSPDEVALLLNYWITPRGRAEVRGGSQRLHSAALNSGAQGYGLTEFTTAAGTKQLIAFAGDSAYKSEDQGVTWTAIAGTASGGAALPTGYWSLATFNTGSTTYLLAANGGASAYKWDGTTWSTWSNVAANTAQIATHNEREWAYASGVLVEGSKVRDPEVYAAPDGLDLYVVTHDGDAGITGLFSLGSLLLVFKRKSVAYIDGYGNSDVIVAAGARGLSRSVGCIAPRSICAVDGSGVLWLSERGFEYYVPGGEIVLVSANVETYLSGVNWSAIESTPSIPAAYYDPERRAYVCWLPGAAGQNDLAFVYRVPAMDQPPACGFHTAPITDGGYSLYVDADGFLQIEAGAARQQGRVEGGFLVLAGTEQPGRYATLTSGFLDLASSDAAPTAICLADFDDAPSRPVAIGSDGFVRRMDYGDADDVLSDGTGGEEIGDRYRTRGMVFGTPFMQKRGRRIRVRAKSQTSVSPTVVLVADGAEGTAHSLTMDGSEGQADRNKARVSGRGDVLQAEIRGAGAGTEIESVEIEAEPLRRRA